MAEREDWPKDMQAQNGSKYSSGPSEKNLNELGAEGWEPVVVDVSYGGRVYVFKRPLP